MNIAKYSLDNPKVIYFFLFVMLIGGVISFGSLGKKEDSPFVIKTAVLITQYPGASPKEVEQLITEPIEREIQSMRRVYKIKSDSYYGMSKINIELSPATPPEEMPQMWDELRRKVLNVQSQLPQGASDIKVSDDFGDVFGIYFSLYSVDKLFCRFNIERTCYSVDNGIFSIVRILDSPGAYNCGNAHRACKYSRVRITASLKCHKADHLGGIKQNGFAR